MPREVSFTLLEPLMGRSYAVVLFYYSQGPLSWLSKGIRSPKREFLWGMHCENASVMWAINNPLEIKWHCAFWYGVLPFSCSGGLGASFARGKLEHFTAARLFGKM